VRKHHGWERKEEVGADYLGAMIYLERQIMKDEYQVANVKIEQLRTMIVR